MTIDEVFEELGEASALTEEYNDIGMPQQTKEYMSGLILDQRQGERGAK